jgi:hypothetical protein
VGLQQPPVRAPAALEANDAKQGRVILEDPLTCSNR